MYLVIVESPTKEKTLSKYLNKDFIICSSVGHVRSLPSKKNSVLPDEDFSTVYELTDNAVKYFSKISILAKKSKEILLATDPDREGEAISWHIIEILKKEKAINDNTKIKRIIFNEITKNAILKAIENPKEINMDLVEAQRARQILDYLVGFHISPVLWKKLPACRSAGRVQSVALRFICEREKEIEEFKTQEYWDIFIKFIVKNKNFEAKLVEIESNKLTKFDIQNEQKAKTITNKLKGIEFFVKSIKKTQSKRKPSTPFTTSSLQQEASRKLGFSAKKTMLIAQKLYEGIMVDNNNIGLITYTRTDSVNISDTALYDIRKFIKQDFDSRYLPSQKREYKTKSKNAQEAHEAIRPTDVFLTPKSLKDKLGKDYFKLYDIIWGRTISSQMSDAIIDVTKIEISDNSETVILRASGSLINFDGFYILYKEGKDDEGEDDNDEKIFPIMKEGDKLKTKDITPKQHFTEPPPRYSEASLVKTLEESGIGRPSTYASIISVLQEREYAKINKKRFIPQERGRIITLFLLEFFKPYVQYDFTAALESYLDKIASGELHWKKLLKKFWKDFIPNVQEVLKYKMSDIMNILGKEIINDNKSICNLCKTGYLSLKVSKFGVFLACSSYPDCKSIVAPFTYEVKTNQDEKRLLGQNNNQNNIYLKDGPYGWYLELSDGDDKKLKRVSIPKGYESDQVTLKMARTLVSLPKKIGKYKKSKLDILLNLSKFGFYLKSGDFATTLSKKIDPFNLCEKDACDILDKAMERKESKKKK